MSTYSSNEIMMNEVQQSENIQSENRIVNIDFLFLDLSVCTRCQGSEGSIEDSLRQTSEFLKDIGYEIKVNRVHIKSEDQAVKHRFISSPTIRIDGQDIQIDVRESHCESCSSLTDGASVDCRQWYYKGKEYSVPPKEMIIDAIMNAIYNPQAPSALTHEEKNFILPDNLHEYFVNRDKLCASVKKSNKTKKHGCGQNSCC